MGVTTSNLVLGPARMYAGLLGATEPADSSVTPNGTTTPPGSPWVDVGGTDGGVTLEIDTTYTDLQVDQLPWKVGARLTDVKATVTTKLSEMTLNNFNTAINQLGQITINTGYTTLDFGPGRVGTQPTYAALIIDGWAPYTASGFPALRRCIVRKVLSTAKVTLAYDRKTQQSYDCTFEVFWVSDSVVPIHLVDQTA